MTSHKHWVFSLVGRLMVAIAVCLLLLFLANLRSKYRYNGPDYGFLLWFSLYALLAGIGILRLKKWGVMLLFVPAMGATILLIVLGPELRRIFPSFAFFVNLSLPLILAIVPGLMLRNWEELQW